MREEILEILYDEIIKVKKYCDAKRYNSKPDFAKNPHDIRNKYLRSLAGLVNVYQKLLADIELDELREEVRQLKEDSNDEKEN